MIFLTYKYNESILKFRNQIKDMSAKIALILFIIIIALVAYYFYKSNQPTQALSPSVEDCIERNGKYEISSKPDGSQTGVCKLPDGSICTDDQYYNEGCYENQKG
jgi:putative hemolysin